MRNLYLHLTCFILLCSAFSPALGQNNYVQISSRIDSLSSLGLPKSALVEVNKLDQLARKNNNTAQLIRAAMYRITLQSYIEENALAANINTLRQDVKRSGYPAKPVLQSLLAETFWKYYQQNRWQINQRSRLLKPDPDFTRWDLTTLFSEVSSLYQSSLINASQLQHTSISVLDDVLTGDKTTRHLRPTLYDLLAHRALGFYLSDESSLNRPREAFNLSDDRLLADSRAFSSLKLPSTDTAAILFKGIQLLQRLTQFHLADGNTEALADVDLRRLQLVYNKSNTAQKDLFYENALKAITQRFADKPISADAWVLLGRYYQAKDSLIDAHRAYTVAKDRFPESIGGKNAVAGLSQLDEKSLSATVESENVPGRPMLALMSYKNVTDAQVQIYWLSVAQMEQFRMLHEKARNEMWQSELVPNVKEYQGKLKEFIKSLKKVQSQSFTMPGKIDYLVHTAEFKLNALPVGQYVLCVDGVNIANRALEQYASFAVSDLAYAERVTPNNNIEVLVMHRYLGKPLNKVKITMVRDELKYNGISQRYDNIKKTYHGVTDGNGKCIIADQQNGSYTYVLVLGNDTLTKYSGYINGETKNESDDPEPKTILFTDRQIYRPGQTIYFKGLQIERLNRQSKVIPGKKLTLELNDANYKTLQKLEFTTNAYGTFAGSFVIPQNILTGDFTLNADDGELSVKVEEYKRPTFKVEFDEVKDTFRFNDSVKVRGKVTAFAGYGLTQARVAYRVERVYSQLFSASPNVRLKSRYSHEPSVKVADDTVKTDDQGNYIIRFKALPGDERTGVNNVQRYEVTADVTDASGETRSAKTSFSIGTHDINLQVSLPDMQWSKDTVRASVKLVTLNNQPLKGKIKVQIFSLQSPGRLFIRRLWSAPEHYTLSASEYQNQFPDYAYQKQDQYGYWPISAKLGDYNIDVEEKNSLAVSLKELYRQPSGVYRVMMSATGINGDTMSVTQHVTLLQNPGKPATLNNWLMPLRNTVRAGEQAEFLVGLGTNVHILTEKYRSADLIASKWVQTTEQKSFKVKVTSKDSDNVAVQYLMLYHNRLYSSYQNIFIQHPEKKLEVKLTSFRNLLQPGQKEEWKLQVSGFKNDRQQAEVLAGMYDASLDDVTPPQSWLQPLDFHQRQHRYFAWSGYGFITENITQSLERYRNYPNPVSRQYEQIDWFGYGYFGGYNNIYHNHIKTVSQAIVNRDNDLRLEKAYKTNATLIKKGYDVSGTVTDEGGQIVPGAMIRIKGTNIGTTTNSRGFYKMKVPVGGTLVFAFIGSFNQEIKTNASAKIDVKLKRDMKALNDVMVVGYGAASRKTMAGAISSIASQPLAGRVPGLVVNEDKVVLRELATRPGTKIMLRGNNSFSSTNSALYVIDGVVVEQGGLGTINANEVISIDILKAAEATAIYGSRAANGAVVITTKAGAQNKKPIVIRKNFNETAFFYPQLHTDKNGQVTIDFTVPESLTKWRFRALAHTPQLASAYVQQDVITQKQLMISANMPRFLREGDTVSVSGRVSNLSLQPVSGKVQLQLFNAVTMQPVNLLMNITEANQAVDLKANTNQAVSFKMVIPTGLDALTYRLTVSSNTSSDGEENTVPVLPNRMLVTESMPMMVRAGQSKAFNFDKLINQQSKTLVNKTLTLEYTQNPAWYAVQALPYLMEFPYECSEQTFSRYLSNSMSASIVNRNPRIKTIFERWKATDSKALLSNLEKNPELKTALLEETPWLRDAVSEADQKKRIALLFDINKLSYEQDQTLDKLQSKQLPGGGFPWFSGTSADRYITQHIVAGIGQLYHMGIAEKGNQKLNNIAGKAIAYIDAEMLTDSKRSVIGVDYLSAIEVHAWYARSYFADKTLNAELTNLRTQYSNKAAKLWLKQDIYEQALIALTMQRLGKAEVTKAIIRSLLERAQQSEDMGMYWAANRSGWYWYQSPVETQALLIELFTEAGGDPKAVEEMKIWLLRNKQTSNWRTTKATAAACYALLMRGADLLADNNASAAITLGGKPLAELKPDIKAEAGTGYLKTSWADELVKPGLGKVQINNVGKTVSWGALYWQYTEQLDKITPSTTDLKLERKYFIQKEDGKGKLLTAIDAQHQPKVGDLVKVVVYLKAGREYEYIHLKDMRPSGTEPVDVLSEYKYQDGLYYYQVTKDVATNFFISRLNKGNYVFEYELRVSQPGNFSTGISTVQSMYAPEFGAHSEGRRLTIGK